MGWTCRTWSKMLIFCQSNGRYTSKWQAWWVLAKPLVILVWLYILHVHGLSRSVARAGAHAGDATHHLKSAKRSTLTTKWGFGEWGSQSPLFGSKRSWQKVHFLGATHLPKIDPGYRPEVMGQTSLGHSLHEASTRPCIISFVSGYNSDIKGPSFQQRNSFKIIKANNWHRNYEHFHSE